MSKGCEFPYIMAKGERLMNKNEKEYRVVLDRRLAEKTFLFALFAKMRRVFENSCIERLKV